MFLKSSLLWKIPLSVLIKKIKFLHWAHKIYSPLLVNYSIIETCRNSCTYHFSLDKQSKHIYLHKTDGLRDRFIAFSWQVVCIESNRQGGNFISWLITVTLSSHPLFSLTHDNLKMKIDAGDKVT